MIAMQYRFRLPTAWDMAAIRTRISQFAGRMDGFPGLVFKAWCYASVDDPNTSSEPLYAPFYLWQDAGSMTHFLRSPGFMQLTRDFGRPHIDSWLVLRYQPAKNLPQPAFARREIVPLAGSDDLSAWPHDEPALHDITRVQGWDVQGWRRLDFQLGARPFAERPQTERYRVGHLS